MIFNKDYFEKVFDKESPWGYSTSEYEKKKYLRQLEAIVRCCREPKNILEAGCAEGIHTAMIAQAFPGARILCVDIATQAIERAKKTCDCFKNVELMEGDIIELFSRGKLPSHKFDVIVQSECLYYLFPTLLFRMDLVSYLRGMARTLTDEGIFVTSNGINAVTRNVMGIYYLILKRYCAPVFSAQYREWNEYRNKHVTYDLRVFRKVNRRERIQEPELAAQAP